MNNKVYKWILKNGKSSLPFIILLTGASVILSLISLQFSMESKKIIDIAIGEQSGRLSECIVRIASLLIVMLAVQIFINFINVHANSRFEISLKNNIFKNLLKKDYLSVSAYHSGELLNRINSDVSIIVSGITTIIPKAALFLTSVVGAFIYLYRIDSFLALVILAVGPFVLVGARVYSKMFKKLHKECQTADGKTKSFMLEMLQNLLVVKSFDNEDMIVDKSRKLQNKSYKLRITRTKVSVFAHIGMFLIFNAGFYFALAYCAYRLSQKVMTVGDVMAVTQLVNQIQSPFQNISGLVPQFFSVIASSERLIELEEIKDEKESGDNINCAIYENLEKIVFDDVEFSYSADSVVSQINMEIKKGEFAVVAGESGAGKSTAIKLLLGILTPDKGKIYLKTKDDKTYYLGKNTRTLFAYVPQGNMILSGTIRENISFANENADEESIIKAAKVAQIMDFIETLDNGLDTVIGENGLGLSEGQAQRISIARALLYDAPVLLLDESTSALDSKTEINLLNSIKSMTDKTVIIVSHKQAAFDVCDKVIYVDKQNQDKERNK